MNSISTAEIMDMGINCLIEKLGTVDTERFISILIREQADYTRWHQRYFADADSEAFNSAAIAYAQTNPL